MNFLNLSNIYKTVLLKKLKNIENYFSDIRGFNLVFLLNIWLTKNNLIFTKKVFREKLAGTNWAHIPDTVKYLK